MSKKLIVYIGRFQLPHSGHASIFKKGLELAKECGGEFLCIIGSCDQPRTHINPFTYEERVDMIKIMNPGENIHFAKAYDYFHDEDWLDHIINTINEYQLDDNLWTFIGCKKYDSEWYINLIESEFPGQFHDCEAQVNELDIIVSSTGFRSLYIDNPHCMHMTDVIGEQFRKHISVIPYLQNFAELNQSIMANLKAEQEYYNNYKDQWVGPYPVQFLAADSIIVARHQDGSSMVLLGRRKKIPGRGLLAIPGGFVNEDETFVQAAKRELEEETCLVLSKYAGYETEVFDKPKRSMRGRVVTKVFLFDADSLVNTIDDAKASDDLESLEWVKISDIHKHRHELFEDHYFILTEMLRIKP